MNRRNFIKTTGMYGLCLSQILSEAVRAGAPLPPVRRLTNGPKFHWFGYYDKWQVDLSGRYVLAMQVDFEGRTPGADDVIGIGMIDLKDGDRWIPLGESRAWGWQQGCMLQWLPGSRDEVIWNDRQEGQFVAVILNVRTGNRRVLPRPVYTVSPDARWAVGLDFGRLQNMRPGYGYKGVPDRFAHLKAPGETGIYTIDLKTGKDQLVIPYSECARLPHLGEDVSDCWHWYNHLLVSPDSKRFVFLNRWRKSLEVPKSGPAFITRMITADRNGGDRYVIDPSGYTSHFVWRDKDHICAWTRPEGHPEAFYLLKDKTGEVTPVGPEHMTKNGHNTYLPRQKNNMILNDSYPQGPERLQALYLYDIKANRRTELGAFHSPRSYSGEWRCDLHPSYSPDGKMVLIDSVHEGLGRQIYLVDISGLV